MENMGGKKHLKTQPDSINKLLPKFNRRTEPQNRRRELSFTC